MVPERLFLFFVQAHLFLLVAPTAFVLICCSSASKAASSLACSFSMLSELVSSLRKSNGPRRIGMEGSAKLLDNVRRISTSDAVFG